eukprot:CAMPEP_0181082798 /NCGR_PEP_ID=MMETSP1071-20121207/3813_1 /TAXON_ID=35127 /ORGANISM="Thalassiosira sp., Strain NH16" /LENGTH=142 /DNA_ID=CAMNT_0023164407 /DNA_START=362 /DNA_END=790 /DNA_ORIENTATION=-
MNTGEYLTLLSKLHVIKDERNEVVARKTKPKGRKPQIEKKHIKDGPASKKKRKMLKPAARMDGQSPIEDREATLTIARLDGLGSERKQKQNIVKSTKKTKPTDDLQQSKKQCKLHWNDINSTDEAIQWSTVKLLRAILLFYL